MYVDTYNTHVILPIPTTLVVDIYLPSGYIQTINERRHIGSITIDIPSIEIALETEYKVYTRIL